MSTTTIAAPKIRCVAPWAGGKRRLASRIVELLGPHDIYREPFVGGCSILPSKSVAPYEWVYDLNPDVIEVLNELRSYPEGVARNLAAIPFSRAEFEAARDRLARPPVAFPPGRRPLDLLVSWWQGPGGIAGTSRRPWFARRHTKTGGCPEKRWKSFVASVPALAARLRCVNPSRADGLALLEHAGWDRVGTAIYCDPPYLDKSFRYAHDFGDADHQRLADILNTYTRARVVVSYRDDATDPGRLARLYPPSKWRRIEVEQSKNMAASQRKAARNTEVILVNDAGAR